MNNTNDKYSDPFKDGHEKGYIEGFRDGYKKGCNEIQLWADEINKKNAWMMAAGQWKRPENELPPEDEGVLAVISGEYKNIRYDDAYTIAYFAGDEGWICECTPECETFSVKAWMRLPEAP